MKELDRQQTEAVGKTTFDKKVCVIAGAGSGKTTTLVARTNYLIEQGVDPKSITCITFTNSASETIKSRILSSNPLGYVGTLHSLMFKLLKKRNSELMVLPDEDSLQILHKYATMLKFRKKSRKYLSQIRRSFWKENLEFENVQLKQLYLNHLESINAYDYDSILLAGLSLLKEEPATYDCDFLLIDEYQDSSEIDLEIYHHICPFNQFAVGDPRQAIYGFRGDYGVTLDGIEKTFDEVKYLQNNYRSNPKIVEFANGIQPEYREMYSKLPDTEDKCISIAKLEDENDEIHFLSNFLLNGNEETAILCRTNSQRVKIEYYLEERGISYDSNKTLNALDGFWKIEYLLNLYDNPANKTASELYLRRLEPSKSDGYYLSALEAMPLVKKDPSHSIVRYLYENGVSKLLLAELSGRIENLEDITDTFDFSQAIANATNTASKNGSNVFVGTMHSSKSKEWDRVILPFCNEDIMPLKNQDYEQERNLFYVACTRAKSKLVITYSKKINDGYSDVDLIHAKPSRFIDDSFAETIGQVKHLH